MSESFPPPERPAGAPDEAVHTRKDRLARLVPHRRGARLAALGAAVVIVGGAAAAVAVAGHHGRGDGPARFSHAGPGHEGGRERGPAAGRGGPGKLDGRADGPRGGMKGRGGPAGEDAAGRGGGAKAAPAPLPSLPVGEAADKAAAAVPGGKVEGLRVVAQQGGGSAWRAIVIGPDGVRHAVTVSGTDGAITGNTTRR
ncbi:hypothetical protein AMK16_02175 [Streptomyces sp. CB00455]|uniref:hypothetical protein n=1 Tax=Streptomyces sp. CB00455 TaxID=1703927 RepID=UPI00093A218E|nr:hypothetical protein [Streptomyces sp. CB00455]OKK22054.1 hypothetical protein AMK16_02175 [Streptomyces sp. CB00455]